VKSSVLGKAVLTHTAPFLMVFTALLILGGCASTSHYLRVTPTTHFSKSRGLQLPPSVSEFLTLHCLRWEGIEDDDKTREVAKESNSANNQCMYLSADVTLLDSRDLQIQERNKIVRALITISDMNCSTFLHRAFANRAGLDYGKKFFQDLTTAISAGTASVSAPLSAAIDVANLVVGKGIDTFNATYYFDKSFQAMEAAIVAERAQRRAYITARLAKPDYLISDALGDIRVYDDACSFRAGLASLNNVAEAKKTDAEKGKASVELAEDSQKGEEYVRQFTKTETPEKQPGLEDVPVKRPGKR
jgi:hypothetical protein